MKYKDVEDRLGSQVILECGCNHHNCHPETCTCQCHN